MRQPTPAELLIVNAMLPDGVEDLTDRDIVVETIVATDNLISRSKSKWHSTAFSQLKDLSHGIPFTLDHDWSEVGKTIARVFQERVVKVDAAPKELLNRCGCKDDNLKAIKDDGGYITLELDVFIKLNSPAVESISYGTIDRVSLGGFDYEDLWCPLCNLSFFDKHCPHAVPDSWYPDQDGSAPYYERKDVTDLGEISAVLIPNVPGAGIKRR